MNRTQAAATPVAATEDAVEQIGADAPMQGDNYSQVTLFPTPAPVGRSKLQIALAQAKLDRDAATRRKAQYLVHLDEVVYGADRDDRDSYANRADAIEAAAMSGKGSADLGKVLVAAQIDQQEMVRKAQEVFGASYIAATDPKRLDVVLKNVCVDHAMLSEGIRVICAAMGTIRVDEMIPVTNSSGSVVLAKRFVDVGDEEAGQTPEVSPKYLLTAALKAARRAQNLREEAKRQHEAAATAQAELATLRKQYDQLQLAHAKVQARNTRLERLEAERGEEADFALPVIVVTNGEHFLKLRPGIQSSLSWAYTVTTSRDEAVTFDTIEQAGAILNQVCMARMRAIDLDILNAMRVARIVTEDHGMSSGETTPTHYPASIALAGKVTAFGKPTKTLGNKGKQAAPTSFDVSVGAAFDDYEAATADDDDAPIAKPIRKPTANTPAKRPAKATAAPPKAPSKPVKSRPVLGAASPTKPPQKPVKPVKAPAALLADLKRRKLAASQQRASAR